MNGKTLLGLLLVLAGIAVLVFGGVSYTSSETIIDVGPVEVQAEEERSLPVEPILAGLAIVGGLALIGVGRKR